LREQRLPEVTDSEINAIAHELLYREGAGGVVTALHSANVSHNRIFNLRVSEALSSACPFQFSTASARLRENMEKRNTKNPHI